jgi:hypothetical protein
MSELQVTQEQPVDRQGTAIAHDLLQQGFCFVAGDQAAALLALNQRPVAQQHAFTQSWHALALDEFLADGGRYRQRRHASLIQDLRTGTLTQVPYRPHWQAKQYNNLHGGILRTFAPVQDAVAASAIYQTIIARLGQLFAQCMATPQWFIEAHQFRLDARGGQALPTPEGAHRDGVDFVALVLIERAQVQGAVTTIYDATGAEVARTTLTTPWSLMLLDDARVTHATTAITPAGPRAWRDTLVLTYRKDGFMDPPAAAK